jgi:5'-nucleotidase / UDP-sugar diphosphatase
LLDVAGQKVGFVGVTTPDTPIASSPGDKVKFLDPLTSVQAEVDRLRASGVTKIIVLSHLGYSQDLALAKQLRGVGVIVGGHSHTPLGKYEGNGLPTSQGDYPTVVKDGAGKTILVLQSWEWGKIYGSLRITFSADGVPQFWRGAPVPVTNAFKNDPRLAATLRAFTMTAPMSASAKPI